MAAVGVGNAVLVAAKLVLDARELVLGFTQEGICLEQLDLGYPEVREVVSPEPDQDGEIDETALLGGRSVALTLTLYEGGSKSAAQWQDEIRRFCHPKLRPRLEYQMRDLAPRYISVRGSRQTAVHSDAKYSVIPLLVTFRGADRSYDVELSSVSIHPGAAAEGRVYDLVYPRDYPLGSELGRIATNLGNADASPVIRIYGPCTDPLIANDTVGRHIKFVDLTIALGDYVELDQRAGTIQLNSSDAVGDNRYGYVDWSESDWWTIEPGDNLLRFFPLTSADETQAVVEWSNAWI